MRTLDKYLFDEYKAGRITIEEAAQEMHGHGWTSLLNNTLTGYATSNDNDCPAAVYDGGGANT